MVLRASALVLLALLAGAVALPTFQQDYRKVSISKYSNQPNAGDGQYRYEFALSDGSTRYEEGQLKNAGVPGKEALVVRGSFSRPRFDGTMEQVMYYADEEGFHVGKTMPPLGGAPSGALIASLVG